MILVVFASPAVAQRNELTGILGRTFVSDQGVTGAVPPDNILSSGKGFTLEANYGRRLIDLGLAGLTFEVPFVINFKQNVDFDLNVVPQTTGCFSSLLPFEPIFSPMPGFHPG